MLAAAKKFYTRFDHVPSMFGQYIFLYFKLVCSYLIITLFATNTTLLLFFLTVLLDDLSALESFLPPLKSFV